MRLLTLPSHPYGTSLSQKGRLKKLMMSTESLLLRSVLAVVTCQCIAFGQDASIRWGNDGRLEYAADARGNRIPDFSHCGYLGAKQPIPHVAARVFVQPTGADDTRRLQAAIDFVAKLKLQPNGFRGAVLLAKGEFSIAGQLEMKTSGVVLRGQGATADGTTLKATGNDRRALIRIHGTRAASAQPSPNTEGLVLDEYVPVGARRLRVSSTHGLGVGDRVLIVHPSTRSWIEQVGGDALGWRPGTRDIRWERTITDSEGDTIELDVPLTMALEKRLAQAIVDRLSQSGHIKNLGVEDLALVSAHDGQGPQDEEHAWFGVTVQSARDAWVRRVKFRHFAGGAVMLDDQTSRASVVDCASFAPISEIGGYRRHTYFTQGQQCLFLRCWSEHGFHDFSVGHCSPGPNAFVNCYASQASGDSGPRESWAAGVLYDNVRIDGGDLMLTNRWNSPPKTGWSAVNCMLWQCQAANIRCDRPLIGNNWAFGIWANPAGNGTIANLSEFVRPISLVQQQLRERLGDRAAERVGPFLLNPIGATNPSIQGASDFVSQSNEPAPQLLDLIRDRWRTEKQPQPASLPNSSDVKQSTASPPSRRPLLTRPLTIDNGWLTVRGKLLTGGHFTPHWWRGYLQPEQALVLGPAITRFAPGRIGTGLTDDLVEVADDMARSRIVGYDHHYGLWYDRRRDDHLMVRRADGEVVPPFYEQPFARTGSGKAWDGLSRYDLTKFNPWYWNRLRKFAELAEQRGLVLFHHNYFQHNVLEAGAHWADSPWRPANNVNETGLPEPPPYIGDKRIFLAHKFYDISNASLRALHRNYVRQCLSNFAEQHNVIQLTSGEYTGPLSFMQFWLDTIVEWEKETSKNVIIGLSCTKDVQDAILSDPIRAPHVDVIDIRYWTYTEDDELYAPPGGKNLSPRQHLRRLKPATSSFASIARAVRECRTQFPQKAVTYYADLYCRSKRDGWAVLMGGGSLANIPALPDILSKAVVRMRPSDSLNLADGQWCLANGEDEFLIYSARPTSTQIRLPPGSDYESVAVNAASGQTGDFARVDNGRILIAQGPIVLWVRAISP